MEGYAWRNVLLSNNFKGAVVLQAEHVDTRLTLGEAHRNGTVGGGARGEELTVEAVELGHAGLGARHTHVGVVGVGQREVGLLQFLNAQGHGVDLLKMILGHIRQVVLGVDTG